MFQLVPAAVKLNPSSNLIRVWIPAASLALSRVAALTGPRAPPRTEAGFLRHASAAGGAPGSAAASYSLSGTAGTSRASGSHVPSVALPGGPSLLLLHVQPDVASELDGLREQKQRLRRTPHLDGATSAEMDTRPHPVVEDLLYRFRVVKHHETKVR